VNDAVHQHSFQAFSQSRRQISDDKSSVFWQNSRNEQISDVSDVKTAIILIEFLIDKNKINRTIFLTINRLTDCYFSQP